MYSKRTLGIRVFFVALGLTAILAFMVFDRFTAFRTGTEVVLKVNANDPRDIMAGDTARFTYDISRLEQRQVNYNDEFETGQRIYVVLRKGTNGFHEAVRATAVPPTLRTDEMVIRGRVTARPARSTRQRVSNPALLVAYGIERHKLPAANQDILMSLRRGDSIGVVAKIGRDGHPVLARLVSGSRNIFEESAFF